MKGHQTKLPIIKISNVEPRDQLTRHNVPILRLPSPPPARLWTRRTLGRVKGRDGSSATPLMKGLAVPSIPVYEKRPSERLTTQKTPKKPSPKRGSVFRFTR